MVADDFEARVARWVRIWTLVHPPLSWSLGFGLFAWLTFTDAGAKQPEWYAIVGGLMGSPVLTAAWGRRQRRGGDE